MEDFFEGVKSNLGFWIGGFESSIANKDKRKSLMINQNTIPGWR